MPQFIDSIEYTDTEGSKVALDGITSVSTVDASTLSVANTTNIIPNEKGVVNPAGRKADSVVGDSSIAFGNNSTASADSSIALGKETIASGGIAIAIGSTAKAEGTHSTALGYAAKASGDSAIALGNSPTASGDSSIALGKEPTASKVSSIAVGETANATGIYSIALGHGTVASNTQSIALGLSSEASGSVSIALGGAVEATGDSSTALGGGAKATGDSSTALGRYSTASGVDSTALGYNTTAASAYSTALGYGASVYSTDGSTMQLGNSTLSALRCKVNLTVTSDKRDKTDIEGITDALAFVERLNPVTFVSNDRVDYISDEDKKGETFRTYGMCEYDRIAHAAGTKKGERRRCGLIAQEVVEAMQSVYGTDNYANIVNDNFHDLTDKPSDVENKYTLAYANLVPFLIGAIKELNAKIEILEGKLATSSVAGVQED